MNYGRKKTRGGEQHSPIEALKKYIVVCSIVLAIIILTIIETSCFAAENSIDWTEDELVFMEEHPVIRLGVDPEFVPFEFICFISFVLSFFQIKLDLFSIPDFFSKPCNPEKRYGQNDGY